MNYRFVLVDAATGKVRAVWVMAPPVTVGRCPTADITIGDASISRRHCQFFLDPYGSLVVRDLASKNGVFVDERRVDKAIVRAGETIRIGAVMLRAELTDEEAADSLEVSDVFDLGETQPMQTVNPEDHVRP
jgi:pSer/pThr/pTyr-binding forkhead associated (FHA) protein